MVARTLATLAACSLFAGCTTASWRATAPHNTPHAWEYNAKLEGYYALRDGWMRLNAPKGFEWDDLTQSYREMLR
jgi:predicted carbohydrate-binding protein with CBM5 and CBM33 domain